MIFYDFYYGILVERIFLWFLWFFTCHICGNGFCSFLFQSLMVFMVFMIFMILNFLFITFLVLFVTLPPPRFPALAALLCAGCKHLFAQVTKQYRAQREREQTLIDRAEHWTVSQVWGGNMNMQSRSWSLVLVRIYASNAENYLFTMAWQLGDIYKNLVLASIDYCGLSVLGSLLGLL